MHNSHVSTILRNYYHHITRFFSHSNVKTREFNRNRDQISNSNAVVIKPIDINNRVSEQHYVPFCIRWEHTKFQFQDVVKGCLKMTFKSFKCVIE